jgi:PAS domain S-box-containing protein
MSALSIPTVVMASVAFYVGLYHLLIYFRRRQHREDLTFALMCLATGFYDAFCAGLYSATSVAEGAQWQRLQFIALAFLTIAFMWFVSDYTHQKPGIFPRALSVFFLVAILIQAEDRSNLTWLVDRPSIKEFLLPLGLKVTYYEATLGPFTIVQGLMGMVASTYIVWSGVRFYKRGHKREAIPLLVALGFVYAAAASDTAVGNDLYHFVYAIEYAYLAMILLMAYSLLSTVVEAGVMRDALRASEERFRSLVETTSDWVWEVDRGGAYTYSSPQVYDLLGYRSEEILGKTFLDLMPPDEARRMGTQFRDAVTNQKPLERLENKARHKDGHLVILETSGTPFRDAYGTVWGYRGIDRDITERKRAEEALYETNETLRALVQSSPLAIIAIDLDGRVTLWNPAAEQMFGWQEHEVLGQILPLVSKDKQNEYSLIRERALRGEVITDIETHRRRKDGSLIDVSLSTAPLRDAQGHVVGSMGLCVDITQRKQMEKALQESEQRFRILAEASFEGIALTTRGVILDVNNQLAQMLGCSREELLGTRVEDCVAPEHRALVTEFVLSGRREPYEHLALRKDGTTFPAEIRARSTHVGNQEVRVSAIRDITERKRLEQQIEERRLYLESILACAPDAIITSDTQHSVLEWNPGAERLFGYSWEEAVGRRVDELIAGANMAAFAEATAWTRQVQERKGILPTETVRYRKDGSPVDVIVSAAPILTGDEWAGVVAVYTDVTERKRAEAQRDAMLEALRESEERFRSVVENSPIGIFIVGDASKFSYVNDKLCRILEYPREEIVGHDFQEFLDDESRPIVVDRYVRRQRGEDIPHRYEFNVVRKDGQKRRAELISAVIKDSTGNVWTVGQLSDVTERKRAEEEIRRLNDELERRVVERTAQLEAAVKELEAFSYSVSHDLRAPLRAIDGFTRILVEDYGPLLDDEGKRVCAVISGNTRHMGQLIDDLLAFSRLSRADMQPVPIDMEALANSAFHQLTTPESRAQIDFRLRALPPAVGDPTLIGQVWLNLLANAIKFSSKRERAVVEVGCQESEGETVYYVRDNGAGFDMRYVGKLFGVFQRLHSEREFEGTGVGLAIVQRMIHRHGGRIWAEAAPDLGATFYFTLE